MKTTDKNIVILKDRISEWNSVHNDKTLLNLMSSQYLGRDTFVTDKQNGIAYESLLWNVTSFWRYTIKQQTVNIVGMDVPLMRLPWMWWAGTGLLFCVCGWVSPVARRLLQQVSFLILHSSLSIHLLFKFFHWSVFSHTAYILTKLNVCLQN